MSIKRRSIVCVGFRASQNMLVYGLRSLGALIIRGLLHIYIILKLSAPKSADQPLARHRRDHCSHIDTTLSAGGVAAAQVTSSLSSGGV